MRVLKCILPGRPSAQQVQPLTKSLTIFMPDDYDYEAERESSNSEQNHAWAFYARARITEREPIFTIQLWAKHRFPASSLGDEHPIATYTYSRLWCIPVCLSLHRFVKTIRGTANIQSTLPSVTFTLFAVQAFRAICASQHQCAAPGHVKR